MAAELPLASASTIRRAWLVLTGAFVIFLLLLTSMAAAAYIYRGSAMQERQARLEATGDVFLQARNERSFKQVRPGELVREGDTIKTQAGSQARLLLFDDNVVVLLAEETEVTIKELRTSRFVTEEKRLALDHRRGWLRLTALPVADYAVGRYLVGLAGLQVVLEQVGGTSAGASFELRPREWPQGQIVANTPLQPRVTLKAGSATLRSPAAPGESPALLAGQSATLLADGRLAVEPSTEREYVRNGDFRLVGAYRDRDVELNKASWAQQWHVTLTQGADGGSLWGTTDVVVREVEGRTQPTIQFWRRFGTKDNAQIGIQQPLNLPVGQFQSLRLRVTFQVIYHKLSGGGLKGSEYPVVVKLTYRDRQNRPAAWLRGYFSHNEENLPVPNGERVIEGEWVTREIDLLRLVDVAGKPVEPAPMVLEMLDIYAEGHDFEARVAAISIVGD
jgi:hypothetical protein